VADKVANFKAQNLSIKSTCKTVLLKEKCIKNQKKQYKISVKKAKNEVTSNLPNETSFSRKICQAGSPKYHAGAWQ
jgi:hypothetical protein